MLRRKPRTLGRTVVLHYHLFKNAGTSLDALLKRQFPRRWVTREFPAEPKANARQLAAWVGQETEAVAFSTHTGLLPPPDVRGLKVVPVIFVRHPVDRIASAYSFERTQDSPGFGATLARNTSLAGYVETRLSIEGDRQCRDFHVARFADMYRGADGSELDRALRAVDALPFVGVVEDFTASLARLRALLEAEGLSGLHLVPVERNVSKGRAESLEERLTQVEQAVGPDLYARLVAENSADLALYDAVARRFPA